jgi:transcriptional regulator GlxA family with amidase domain
LPSTFYLRIDACSAGVTAGIDLALKLIEDDHGRDLASMVARRLVVFLKRPGGQSQFSAHLAAQMADEGKIRSLQHWILDHLSLDLTLDALASRAAMSVRNFTRVFQGETGTTPADFVEMARVDAARRVLEESETPLATRRVALRLRESGYDATGVSEKNRHRAQRLSGTISTVTSLRSSSQSQSRWIAFY